MNTCICFIYRDAENNKLPNRCVIREKVTEEQVAEILNCCDPGGMFIPSKVGMPGEQFAGYNPEYDGPYFELGRCSFSETTAEPEIDMTGEELVTAFRNANGRWMEVDDIPVKMIPHCRQGEQAISPKRVKELLDLVIDHLIELEGGHANRVAQTLSDLGFTAEDLQNLQFPV